MNLVTALAIVIGVIGAVLTYAYLGPLAGLNLQIWATFIAAAAFFHSGGGEAAIKSNIPAHIWGALLATVALYGVVTLGVTPLNAALCVGVTVIALVLGAHVPLLASIPSAVYGYASTAAFTLLAAKTGSLISGGIGENPFLTITISLIIGNLYGYVSGKIGAALAK